MQLMATGFINGLCGVEHYVWCDDSNDASAPSDSTSPETVTVNSSVSTASIIAVPSSEYSATNSNCSVV